MSNSDSNHFELRTLDVQDAEFLLGLMQTSGYLQFVGNRGVESLEQARDYIRNYFLASQAQHGFGYDVALVNGQPAGMVGLMKRDYLDYPDIGFAFMPEFEGRGIAYKSCLKYLDKVAPSLSSNNLVAFTNADNTPSQKLLERLQFEFVREFEHPQEQVPMMEYQYCLN